MPKGVRANLAGREFGHLIAMRREGRTARREALWRCRCICGRECHVPAIRLTSGVTRSCGQKHYFRNLITKVAKAELNIWHLMLDRCYNPRNGSFKNYGARGIRVCDRWHRFEDFLSDMGPRPSPKHSVDRFPDMDGSYEPGNCRWATSKQQRRNTRANVFVEVDGTRYALSDFAETLGLTAVIVRKRLARGWSLNEALSLPAKKHKSRAVPEEIVVKARLDKT